MRIEKKNTIIRNGNNKNRTLKSLNTDVGVGRAQSKRAWKKITEVINKPLTML